MGNDQSGPVNRTQLDDKQLLRSLFSVPEGVQVGDRLHVHGLALSRFSVLNARDDKPPVTHSTRAHSSSTDPHQHHLDDRDSDDKAHVNDDKHAVTSSSASSSSSSSSSSTAGAASSPSSTYVQDSELWRDIQLFLMKKKKTCKRPFTLQQDRAMGVMLGNAIGDSLGAPLEFSSVQYGVTELVGFDEDKNGTYFVPLPPELLSDEERLQMQQQQQQSGGVEESNGSRRYRHRSFNTFRLHAGQWTDDNSMALCMAESLLACQRLDIRDMRLRFLNWWRFGYCTAFGWDVSHHSSVGLGGNISASFNEFVSGNGIPELTKAGDSRTSGNGSVMRLGPIPVFFANDVDAAMDAARRSSLSTHQGEEAAECCRLLAFLCVHAINLTAAASSSTPFTSSCSRAADGKVDDDEMKQAQLQDEQAVRNKDLLLNSIINSFTSPLYAVTCLARSEAEQAHPENEYLRKSHNKSSWSSAASIFSSPSSSPSPSPPPDRELQSDANHNADEGTTSSSSSSTTSSTSNEDSSYLLDRNWNWRVPQYHYSPTRARLQPGYVGSYAMDAVCMALHCVHSTTSFVDALVKAANTRGDSDSVTAVVGQLAGAIYGASRLPVSWIRAVQRWDQGGRIAMSAYLLYDHDRQPTLIDEYLRPEIREWRHNCYDQQQQRLQQIVQQRLQPRLHKQKEDHEDEGQLSDEDEAQFRD